MNQDQTHTNPMLEIIESDGSRREVPIDQLPFRFGCNRGRSDDNHLHLPDERISRKCGVVISAGDRYQIEDRGQRRGLFVNRQKVEKKTLEENDRITFGVEDCYELIFHAAPRPDPLTDYITNIDSTTELDSELRGLRQLNLFFEATKLLQSHVPHEELLLEILGHAIELAGADRGLLLEADSDGELSPLVARVKDGRTVRADAVKPSRNAIARALKARQSEVVQDTALHDALDGAVSVQVQQLRSIVAIPLYSFARLSTGTETVAADARDLLGVLYLDSQQVGTFGKLERRILDWLAQETATALQNARFLRKEQERKELEQELSIGRRIQQALLPTGFPESPHFQLQGTNRPCLAVGGDYFDFMELGSDRVAFIIADVSGKGLGAALVAAVLQGMFTAMAVAKDPVEVFARINDYLIHRMEPERFITVFFGILNSTGELKFINAGHLSPILVSSNGVDSPFPSRAVPVGLIEGFQYQMEHRQLNPGDLLAMYTDGISEAMNPAGEMYGAGKLQEWFLHRRTEDLLSLQGAILKELDQFQPKMSQADDVTLFLFRYSGT